MREEKNTIEEEQFDQDPYLGVYCLPVEIVDLNTDENYIEVEVYQDIYKENKKSDNFILVKKDVISKQVIYKDEVTHIKEVVNKLGYNRISRVELGLRSRDPIIVVGTYTKFKSILFDKNKQNNKTVGFKWY